MEVFRSVRLWPESIGMPALVAPLMTEARASIWERWPWAAVCAAVRSCWAWERQTGRDSGCESPNSSVTTAVLEASSIRFTEDRDLS